MRKEECQGVDGSLQAELLGCMHQAWDETDDVCPVGYARVLESPAVAYSELQEQYFAAQLASPGKTGRRLDWGAGEGDASAATLAPDSETDTALQDMPTGD